MKLKYILYADITCCGLVPLNSQKRDGNILFVTGGDVGNGVL